MAGHSSGCIAATQHLHIATVLPCLGHIKAPEAESLLCCCAAVCPGADCLYDCDIPSDVQYLHVQLVAKELPPLDFVREVARAANNFWAKHPDLYIAIHCAYGTYAQSWAVD